MIGALRLNGETFRELRDDQVATAQSIFIVAVASLCYGGGLSLSLFFLASLSAVDVIALTLADLIAGLAIAFVWSGVTFVIVTRVFHKKIDYLNLARPFFFSWTPGLVFIFMASPIAVVSELVRAIGTVWIVLGTVFAVKHAAGVSTIESVGTFTLCGLLLFLVLAVLQF